MRGKIKNALLVLLLRGKTSVSALPLACPFAKCVGEGCRTNPLLSPFCNKGESVAAGDERGLKYLSTDFLIAVECFTK